MLNKMRKRTRENDNEKQDYNILRRKMRNVMIQ